MATALSKLATLHARLGGAYERMDQILARDDARLFRHVPEISAWSVANQLHHTAASTALMLIAVDRIARQKSPAQDGGRLTTIGRAVLLTRKMPRGKGKAPERTVPPETLTREDLTAGVARSRSVYDRTPDILETAAPSSWRTKHPYFGWLGPAEWLKLASLHADHHFAIIEEIDRA